MKHKIDVPEGCRVVSVETTDDMVVVKFEKEEPKLKKNDIIVIDENIVAILNNRYNIGTFYEVNYYFDKIQNKSFRLGCLLSGNVRLATEEEKKILFDSMKKENLTFDGNNILELKPEFKENDIVYTEYVGYGRVSILKNSAFSKSSSNGDMFADTKVTMHVKTDFSLTKNENLCFSFIRLATDSEKQLLFDKLKEKCLMFDGENIVRWRANPNGKYFYLPGDGDVAETEDDMSNWDDGAYHIGNYFPTREMAESFQKQYLELLNNFHKNFQQ